MLRIEFIVISSGYPAIFRLDPLLKKFASLLKEKNLVGPILDLACGEGGNGLFLTGRGLPVILADRSAESLAKAKKVVEGKGLDSFKSDIPTLAVISQPF
jgi:ubiquinone/menaquinone biosynthesis C-methylase UbiE